MKLEINKKVAKSFFLLGVFLIIGGLVNRAGFGYEIIMGYDFNIVFNAFKKMSENVWVLALLFIALQGLGLFMKNKGKIVAAQRLSFIGFLFLLMPLNLLLKGLPELHMIASFLIPVGAYISIVSASAFLTAKFIALPDTGKSIEKPSD